MAPVATAAARPIAAASTSAAAPAARSARAPRARAWMPGAGASDLTGRVLVLLARPRAGRPGGRGGPPTARLLLAHASRAQAEIARAGARPDGPVVAQLGLETLRPPPGIGVRTLAARLRRLPGVRWAQPEVRFLAREVPDDPAMTDPESAVGTPPSTPVEWWALREGFAAAWDLSHGDGTRVAVVDSGVDAGHPELAGKLDLLDDVDATPGDGPAGTDRSGHGTHVAGLACAAAGNALGLAGAGYACHLIVEKTDYTEASVAEAIVNAADHGAVAVNMSFGTDGSLPAPQALIDAVDYAYRRNVVLVAAAADSPVTEQGDPANVLQPAGTGADITQGRGLSVTSADYAGQRSSFAGMGSEISLAAFGSFYDSAAQGGPPGLLSTFPAQTTTIEQGTLAPLQPPCTNCRTTFHGDSRYAYLEGTSMAAPQVSGTVALMRALNPRLTAGDVIRIIKQSAARPPGTGWTPDLGWGILDAGAALAQARTVDRTPPVSHLTAPHRTTAAEVVLTVSGQDPAPAPLVASGIDHYDIFRTVDGRAPQRIASIPAGQGQLRVRVHPGHLYGWFSVAVDRAGNREARSAAEVRTRVLAAATPRRRGRARARRRSAR